MATSASLTPSLSRPIHNGVGSGESLREGSRPDSPDNDAATGQGSLILRIKRKRGADPVAALRIGALLAEGVDRSEAESQVAAAVAAAASGSLAGTSPEDPATAAAAQLRRKRRLTDRGVFRLAETVPLSSFDTPEQRKQLEDRIAKLKRCPSGAKDQRESASTAAAPPTPPRSQTPPPTTLVGLTKASTSAKTTDQSQLRFKVISSSAKTARKTLLDTLKGNNSSGSLRLRQRPMRSAVNGPRSNRLSTEVGSRPSPYARPRYVDAVIESNETRYRSKMKQESRQRGTQRSKEDNALDEEMKSLDRRFAGLLGDYLRDQDLEAPKDILNAASPEEESSSAATSDDDSEDDYVYDIYYRDRGETAGGAYGSSSMAASAAHVGLTPSEVTGHDQELSHSGFLAAKLNAAATAAVQGAGSPVPPEPMAMLVGLTERDFFDQDDEEIIEQGSQLVSEALLDSDDPYEDNEDEDSNDEDFYRNDYPEQEAEEDDEVEGAGWGWTGPRRHAQDRRRSDSSEEDGDDDDADEEDNL